MSKRKPHVGDMADHKSGELDPRPVAEVSEDGRNVRLQIGSTRTPWLQADNYDFDNFDDVDEAPETKCPRCGRETLHGFSDSALNALSRKDNKTKICSSCGTDEAMRDYAGSDVWLSFPEPLSPLTHISD